MCNWQKKQRSIRLKIEFELRNSNDMSPSARRRVQSGRSAILTIKTLRIAHIVFSRPRVLGRNFKYRTFSLFKIRNRFDLCPLDVFYVPLFMLRLIFNFVAVHSEVPCKILLPCFHQFLSKKCLTV